LRLAGRAQFLRCALQSRHGLLRLQSRGAGIEIDLEQLCERAPQALDQRIGLALPEALQRALRSVDPRNDRAVVLAAVEHVAHALDLRCVLEAHLGDHG
jgi:hypothetical protein